MLSMYPAFFALIWSSHATLMESIFWQGPEQRMTSSSAGCDFFASLYIATNLVQAIGQLQTESGPLLWQLMAHHVMSIFCYGCGFYFDRFRFWTAFGGASEITNLCLVPVQAAKELPEIRKQTWYKWNAWGLLVLFITHRLVLFPAWLWLWTSDRMALVQKMPPNEQNQIHWLEGMVYPGTVLGLIVLSLIWFKQIVQGVRKLYRDLSDVKRKD